MAFANKIPIAVLIGGGSKLPAILKASKDSKSKFYIALVISHKKESDGVDLALKNGIPAVYFNLPDYRKRTSQNNSKVREDYMKQLGWFISQPQYAPKLLVFAGWDLVVDENFMNFFKCDFGNGYAAINLHPALLPTNNEKDEIDLPDGTKSPIIKGEQKEVLQIVLKKNLSYFGPTIHFMVPTKFDTGKVIAREFIDVDGAKSAEEMRKKLLPTEDRILVGAINEVIDKYLT